MIDEQSEAILGKLYPPFVEKLRQLVGILGESWRVIEGFRSFAEQDAYFEQGRSRPGAVITRDRAGYSGHCYGVVAHVVPTVDGRVAWDDNAAFLRLAVEAQKLGLAWGGTWGDKLLEKSRVEMIILTMDECLALFKKGLPILWAAFDAKLGVQSAEPVVAESEEVVAGEEALAAPEGNTGEVDAEVSVDEGDLKVSSVVARRKRAGKKATPKK